MPVAQRPSSDPSLLQQLYEAYFRDEPAANELAFTSSHWIHENQYLQAIIDSGSGVVPVSQAYWGCNWNGLRSRIIDQLCVLSHFVTLPRKKDILRYRAVAADLCSRMGLDPTFTVFRQFCSFELVHNYLPSELRDKPKQVLVIGDGIGVLSALFKSVFPDSTIVLVDIGKTLLYQAYFVQRAHPNSSHQLARLDTNFEEVDFVYCPAEQLDTLDGARFDLAVNVNSMQEMNRATVENYFTFLRKHLNPNNLFYCCNRERKVMPGGEISEILNYPWRDGDRYLVDEECPWQRYYFSRQGAVGGPRLLGVKMPFTQYYDGTIWHRLAVLATD